MAFAFTNKHIDLEEAIKMAKQEIIISENLTLHKGGRTDWCKALILLVKIAEKAQETP